MILQNKNAVIYGAGGSLAGAIAKAFAAAGAKVFIAGRRMSTLEKVAEEILATGGQVEASAFDAMDEMAVQDHMEGVVKKAGKVDLSFNGVAVDVLQGIPMTEIPCEAFLRPATGMLRTRFLTAMAAAKVMMKQKSGVILSLTATPGGIGYPYTGGFGPACAAIENMTGSLAAELGIYGIRVVNIRSGGSPDSQYFKDAIESNPVAMGPIIRKMEDDTMLKKLPLMADIANTAIFLASDLAARITGVTIDVTCGTTVGLNYRAARLDQH